MFAYPRFGLSKDGIKHTVNSEILPCAEAVKVKTRVNAVKGDITGNKFPALAVDGKADMIVSGDRHLLTLRVFRGISIIPPGEFLAMK